MTWTRTTHTPEETRRLGEEIGSRLTGDEVLCLYGEVGAGKTCISQGIINSVNPESGPYPRSPTYSIINRYNGKSLLFHIDLYRLNSEEELVDLGFEDILDSGGIFIIEWAEKLGALRPEKRVDITFSITGEQKRSISISPVQDSFSLL